MSSLVSVAELADTTFSILLPAPLPPLRKRPPGIGTQWYLSPWWVEVTGYTPKTRFVRYRLTGMETTGRLSLARWGREARPV